MRTIPMIWGEQPNGSKEPCAAYHKRSDANV